MQSHQRLGCSVPTLKEQAYLFYNIFTRSEIRAQENLYILGMGCVIISEASYKGLSLQRNV